MSEITSALGNSVDSILVQLITWIGIPILAYIGTFLILRLIKVPKGICSFAALIVLVIVIYKSFFSVYIPGITGNS